MKEFPRNIHAQQCWFKKRFLIDTSELRQRDPHSLLKQNYTEVFHKSPRESLATSGGFNVHRARRIL